MTRTTLTKPLTTADLLAMPDDGIERWLIDGELRQKPKAYKDRFHSKIMVRLAHLLGKWRDLQPLPRGELLCSDVGVVLHRDPDTSVGIDVVYISAELAAKQNEDTTMIDGVPDLFVEILSPQRHARSDRRKDRQVPRIWRAARLGHRHPRPNCVRPSPR